MVWFLEKDYNFDNVCIFKEGRWYNSVIWERQYMNLMMALESFVFNTQEYHKCLCIHWLIATLTSDCTVLCSCHMTFSTNIPTVNISTSTRSLHRQVNQKLQSWWTLHIHLCTFTNRAWKPPLVGSSVFFSRISNSFSADKTSLRHLI